MIISINEPACLNETGGRKNNEDSVFPGKGNASKKDKLFIVCDGVGGSEYGEVASNLACEALADFILLNENYDIYNSLYFINNRFLDYFKLLPEYAGMATTLVFLLLGYENITLGWIGDSRIYHIREGNILYQTKDHSLVNKLIKEGKLTPDEAKYDFRKHFITRTINGTHNLSEMEFKIIDNIQAKDYFLLCSDGLLEKVDEVVIGNYFNGINEPYDIKNEIYHLCEGHTSDNYSMYIIQVE
jgi:serine/threonine protein phosphatase PrpC